MGYCCSRVDLCLQEMQRASPRVAQFSQHWHYSRSWQHHVVAHGSFQVFFPLHNQPPRRAKHAAFVHPTAWAICISIAGDCDVIRMKVSRCEISYLLRGQVVPSFNLQEEMNRVVWECGGLSLVIVPAKCFIKALPRECIFFFFGLCADKMPIRSHLWGVANIWHFLLLWFSLL